MKTPCTCQPEQSTSESSMKLQFMQPYQPNEILPSDASSRGYKPPSVESTTIAAAMVNDTLRGKRTADKTYSVTRSRKLRSTPIDKEEPEDDESYDMPKLTTEELEKLGNIIGTQEVDEFFDTL